MVARLVCFFNSDNNLNFKINFFFFFLDEDSVLAVACAEQISIWDLSLERDTDAQAAVSAQPEQQDDGLFFHIHIDKMFNFIVIIVGRCYFT